MDFYERVEALRKERKMSQADLEKALEISNGSVSKWKKSFPTYDRLEKLSNFFNVSVEYLTTGKEPTDSKYTADTAHLVAQIRKDAELTEALKKYFSMSEEQKKHVIATINMISKE